MRIRTAIVLHLLLLLGACNESPSTNQSPSRATPTSATLSAEEQRLSAAASDLVRFLQGKLAFSEIETSSTVTLRLSKAGGAISSDVTRELLSDPKNWQVQGSSGTDYSFLPPKEGQLVTKPGKHLNCMEYDLASAVDGLGRPPHVGTMIKPNGSDTCLRVWNVTFIFDPQAPTPTLISAVYDQWEW